MKLGIGRTGAVEEPLFREIGAHFGVKIGQGGNFPDRLCTWLRLDQHVNRKPSKWTGRSQLLAANSRNRSYVHKRFFQNRSGIDDNTKATMARISDSIGI